MNNIRDHRYPMSGFSTEKALSAATLVMWLAVLTPTMLCSAPQSASSNFETSPAQRISMLHTGTHTDSTSKATMVMDHRNMVLVEGGTFQMGSETNKPIHTVKLKSFYIDKYEVTVGDFRKFRTAKGKTMPDGPPWGWKDDHPIVGVSWEEAVDYAAWVGKRLPTEAEWEYAARGGTKSNGFVYSGSNSLGDVAWYQENSGKSTHPVGTKGPNELGLYDMSGNAAEWCSDWYSGYYYRTSTGENPAGPRHGAERVVRGGSFIGDQFDCKVTFRRSAVPQRSGFRYGFRCAMSK